MRSKKLIASLMTIVMLITMFPLNAFASSNVFYSISPGSKPLRGSGSGGSGSGYPPVTYLGYGLKWGITNVMSPDGKEAKTFDLTKLTPEQAYTQINNYATSKYQKQYVTSKAGMFGIEHRAATKVRNEIGNVSKVETYEPLSNTEGNPGYINSIVAYQDGGSSLPGNYAGQDLYDRYLKEGHSSKEPLTWAKFKSYYIDGDPTCAGATFNKNQAVFTIQQLSQGGTDVGSSIKTFIWDGNADKSKSLAGYLGLLAALYKSTDSSVSKNWDPVLSDYVNSISDPLKCAKFKPTMVTVEVVAYMGFALGSSEKRVIALTLPQYYSLLFGQKEYMFYDWLYANPPSVGNPSTYQAIKKVHDHVAAGVGGKGIAGCCMSGTNYLKEQLVNTSGFRVYSGEHDGNKYPAGPPSNTGGCYGLIKSGNLNGFGVFGAAILPKGDPPHEFEMPKGRFGIAADPHAKQVTKDFTESVDLDVSIHQVNTVPKDKVGLYDSWGTWLKFFEDVTTDSKKKGITPTYHLVYWVKSTKNEADVDADGPGDLVKGNSPNFVNAVETQVSLDQLKKLMDPATKDTEVFTAIVKDKAPTKYYWKAGIAVRVKYNGAVKFSTMLHPDPKHDLTVFTTDSDQPHYYSEVATPYAEIKTGEINNEPFNAMQGTPTTRNLFFASGGSEFVVQMDAEFVTAKTATRTYSMAFSAVNCDQNTIVCSRPCAGGHNDGCGSKDSPCPGHSYPGDDCACPHTLHSDHGIHQVADTATWSQQIEGLTYMKIKDAKIWKLAKSRVDGMYYLTDQDEFYADVQSIAPEAMWNIAQADTAAQGRVYHSFDQNKMLDSYVFPTQASNNGCSAHGNTNMATLKSKIAAINGGKDKVTCVSDYLVLRTTNGDQSIMYYEYDSDSEVPIYKNMTVTPTSPAVGTTTGTINVTADPIKFTKVLTQDMLWKNNNMTSENIKMKPGDVTYGGYNGDYMNMSTKYKSTSGSVQNINLSSLAINKPGYNKGSVSNSGAAVPAKPGSVFKLMNKNIDIPNETKENKEYITGFSDVFYQNILNYGSNVPNYPITSNPGRYTGNGFVLNTTYSPNHDKINDVVVHNPVSTQYSMTLSLPEDRDQRTDTYKDLEVMKPIIDETCPGISSECEYSALECIYTGGSIHTDACYSQTEVPHHGPDNVHKHTADCYHKHTSACGHVHIPEGQPKACYQTGYKFICYSHNYISVHSEVSSFYYCIYCGANMQMASSEYKSHLKCMIIVPGDGSHTHGDNCFHKHNDYCGHIHGTKCYQMGYLYRCKRCGNQNVSRYSGQRIFCDRAGCGIMEQITNIEGNHLNCGRTEVLYCGYTENQQLCAFTESKFTCGKTEGELVCDGSVMNDHDCKAGSGDLAAGSSKTFSYTGNIQSVTLNPGTYKLEAWGAAGGSAPTWHNGARAGYGGYMSGTVTFSSPTTLFIGVGQKGTDSVQSSSTTFNGGGSGATQGGGATHIATLNGQLADLRGNTDKVLLVAGGGAGSSGAQAGGDGGYPNGTAGGAQCGGAGTGGTQTSGGAGGSDAEAGWFGQGGSTHIYSSNSGSGGGGGYYGGGGGGHDHAAPAYDDSGGGGGSSYYSSQLSSVSHTTGNNTNAGVAKITAISVTEKTECYTTKVMTLKCSEPHHGYGSGWQTYTKGLQHKDGATCTGSGCTNNTDLQMTTGKWVTVNALANGFIVKHSSGKVHVSSNNGECDYCGSTVKEVLGRAASGKGALLTKTEHNPFGDPTCYRPCNNDNNHKKLPGSSTDKDGNVVKAGEFINLDFGFTLYFPNKGDFYGNGAQASGSTSKTEGSGYIDGMDTTEWTRSKYVIFPFNVVSLWDNKSHQAGTPIFLDVPTEYFKFYCALNNSEMASARVTYYSIANNNIRDSMDNELPTNYDRYDYLGAKHSAYKEQFIDVVGRIGAMTIEDTGDFRFANLFKKALAPVQWLVNQVVKKVDYGVQNKIVADAVDVRGLAYSAVTNQLDTYGVRPERRQTPILLPLTPSKNNVQALVKQPVRIGYNVFVDLTTLGNYYGENPEANYNLNRKVQITPYYYHLNLTTGEWTPVDVYMNVNKVYRAINLFGNDAEANYPYKTPLNWLEEAKRRNYNGKEKELTEAVVDEYSTDTDKIGQPQGSYYEFGTAQRFHLKERNRTFLGTEFPNTIDRDPSDLFEDIVATRQGQRWHFTVGLPSSAVFVKEGQACTQTNINSLRKSSGVIVCALDITASGEVWNLKYKGDNINQPFKVTPTSPTYDPKAGPGTPPGDKPVVTVFSVDKSSKDDLGIEGTQ